ncbi:MAG: hypothetical protein ACK5Q5_15640 [Planctomycetaceae bacterium]
MRVRFYKLGDNTVGEPLRCDVFPLMLGLEAPGSRLQTQSAEPVCRIDDAGGQLLFEGLDDEHTVLVNGDPLASGPLKPGDHLSVDGLEYVVSYEQTGDRAEVESRYRLAGR